MLDWTFHHFDKKKSVTHNEFESDVQLFLHLRKGKHGILSPHFNYLFETHPIIVECMFCIHIR